MYQLSLGKQLFKSKQKIKSLKTALLSQISVDLIHGKNGNLGLWGKKNKFSSLFTVSTGIFLNNAIKSIRKMPIKDAMRLFVVFRAALYPE